MQRRKILRNTELDGLGFGNSRTNELNQIQIWRVEEDTAKGQGGGHWKNGNVLLLDWGGSYMSDCAVKNHMPLHFTQILLGINYATKGSFKAEMVPL